MLVVVLSMIHDHVHIGCKLYLVFSPEVIHLFGILKEFHLLQQHYWVYSLLTNVDIPLLRNFPNSFRQALRQVKRVISTLIW